MNEPGSLLARKAAERLDLPVVMIRHIQVVRRAIDARARQVRFVHTADVALSDPAAEAEAIAKGKAAAVEPAAAVRLNPGTEEVRGRIVVVGCGPAGLFAALQLAKMGYRPLLLERGGPVAERSRDVGRFLSSRELDADSNLLFGAGGAGTYSDGKLYSRIRDPRVRSVLESVRRRRSAEGPAHRGAAARRDRPAAWRRSEPLRRIGAPRRRNPLARARD